MFGEKTIKAAGVVVYVDRQDDGPWRNGVQFTEISEDDRDALLGAYLQQEYRIDPAARYSPRIKRRTLASASRLPGSIRSTCSQASRAWS